VKTRLKRFVILGLIGLGSKALRKRIQRRNQAAEDDRRMAREAPTR
jgi:hypothetical protein